VSPKPIRSKGPFRCAFVTGASSGIGKAICRLLAKEGIHLVITGRNKLSLYEIADELRDFVNVVVYPANLTDRDERAQIIQKIHQLSPDLVINNAGYGLYGLGTDVDLKSQLDMIELNVSALVEITVEAARAMMEARHPGVIMNISSVAGFFPFPGFSVYGASKAFVNSYSQAMDAELSGQRIRVLASCPGMVETNFSLRASQGKYQSQGEKKMTPEYAAKQIWKQILHRTPIRAFSFKYRVAAFLLQHVIPRRFSVNVLKRRILQRLHNQNDFTS